VNPVLFPVFALAVGAMVMGYAVWMQPARRARRLLRRAANRAIGDLKHGEWVKVTGIVSPLAPLIRSPVGEHDCIGFRVDVERVDGGQPTVFERQACGAFSVADGSGTVDVEGPFLFGLDAEGNYSTMRPRLLEALEAAGAAPLEIASYRGFAFREALLRPGDRVTVVGQVFLEPDPRANAIGARSPPLALRMTGSRQHPIVIADADDRVSQ
jgi:hypothetical protein